MGKLEGKVAVTTGAASGIGRASAIRFAAVVVADLNSQGGELVVSEIAAKGGRALSQRTGVTSEPEIKSLIDRAVREYGRLDITYNNAGVGGPSRRDSRPCQCDRIRRWRRPAALD